MVTKTLSSDTHIVGMVMISADYVRFIIFKTWLDDSKRTQYINLTKHREIQINSIIAIFSSIFAKTVGIGLNRDSDSSLSISRQARRNATVTHENQKG